MDERLIHTDTKHTEDPQLGDEGKFESKQGQQRNRSSDRQEDARDDDGCVSDIVELYD